MGFFPFTTYTKSYQIDCCLPLMQLQTTVIICRYIIKIMSPWS